MPKGILMLKALWDHLDFMRKAHFLGAAAAIVGIAGGIDSLTGGNDAPSSGNYIYSNPHDASWASNFWKNALARQDTTNRSWSNATQNPLMDALMGAIKTQAPGISTLGPRLGETYGKLAGADAMYADILGGAGGDALSSLFGAGKQVWNTSLDPQGKLHDKILQSLLDTSGSRQAARGIQMSGVGQGIDDQLTRDFELAWSNELLGRQVQGLTAMEQAMGAGSQIGGQNFAGASDFYGRSADAMIAEAMAPYTASGLTPQWLASLVGGLNPAWQGTQVQPFQQMQNQIVPFMYQGNGAGQNAWQADMNAFNTNNSNRATGWESLMTGLGELGNADWGWLGNLGGGQSGGGGGSWTAPNTWGVNG